MESPRRSGRRMRSVVLLFVLAMVVVRRRHGDGGRDAAHRERVERRGAGHRRQAGGMVVAARDAGLDAGFAWRAQRRPVSVRGAGVQRPGRAHDARRSRVHGLDGPVWQREEVVRHHRAAGDGRGTRDAGARPGRRRRVRGPAAGRTGQEGGPAGPKGPAVGTITSIEVLGPGKDDKRRLELAYARTIGLDVAARLAEGVLVYELRVPLSATEAQPYGVKSVPGATIGLGIESAKLQPPGGREGEGGRSGMGGRPPGGGGGGTGGGWAGGGRADGGGNGWRDGGGTVAGWAAASAEAWAEALLAAAARACAR